MMKKFISNLMALCMLISAIGCTEAPAMAATLSNTYNYTGTANAASGNDNTVIAQYLDTEHWTIPTENTRGVMTKQDTLMLDTTTKGDDFGKCFTGAKNTYKFENKLDSADLVYYTFDFMGSGGGSIAINGHRLDGNSYTKDSVSIPGIKLVTAKQHPFKITIIADKQNSKAYFYSYEAEKGETLTAVRDIETEGSYITIGNQPNSGDRYWFKDFEYGTLSYALNIADNEIEASKSTTVVLSEVGEADDNAEFEKNISVEIDTENLTAGTASLENGTLSTSENAAGTVTVTAKLGNITFDTKTITISQPEPETHTITWNNDDGTLIDTTTVTDGEMPTHADAVKASTAEYDYTFAGWSPQVTAATENTTYTATFTATKRKYTVTWKNGETVLETDENVEYGVTPSYDGETPTKAADEDNTYSFSGWSPEVSAVTGDATYTAQFTSAPREYTITYNINGHGTAPTGEALKYTAGTAKTLPILSADGYTFGGWYTDDTTFNIAAVITTETRGNQTFYAKWTENAPETVTITWSIDGETTQENVAVGAQLAHDAPTKAATAQYTYTFKGWSETENGDVLTSLPTATTNATYYAVFEQTVNKYTVTWRNGETVLETDENVEYGTTPSYDGVAPTKAADEEYTYTFVGWALTENGEKLDTIPQVTADAIYYAIFTATKKEAPKTYLSLLPAFDNIMVIEKANGENNAVVLTATAKDGQTIPEKLCGYLAVYDGEVLASVTDITFDNEGKASVTIPNGTYKVFIWNDMTPVTAVLTATDFN